MRQDVGLLLAVLGLLFVGVGVPVWLGRAIQNAGTRREPLPRAAVRPSDR